MCEGCDIDFIQRQFACLPHSGRDSQIIKHVRAKCDIVHPRTGEIVFSWGGMGSNRAPDLFRF